MPATMKDIARKTGLGLATISKYLNGGTVRPENKRRIDEAIKALRYVPNGFARSLRTRQSRTIGVLIPELNNAFITSIITTMEDLLRQQDYAVIVCDCRTDIRREKEAVTFLMHKRVDGLINMPTDPSGAHLAQVLEMNVPVMLVDRMVGPLAGRVSAVVVDNADAAEKATGHLLRAGHMDIGLILGNPGIYTVEHRRAGYLSALRQYNRPVNDKLIVYSDYTMEGGYAATKRLLALADRPTALFVTNYEMTLGAMIACQEARVSIPEDCSFIGFDKLDLFGAVYPYLTLMKQPQHAIGESVARQMLALLGDTGAVHQTIVMTAQLHEGSSVKPRQALPQ